MYVTVQNLIDELKKYHPDTPILGFCHHDGYAKTTNQVSVLGVYPDAQGLVDNVQLSFWSPEHDPVGKVNPTGEKWEGGMAAWSWENEVF